MENNKLINKIIVIIKKILIIINSKLVKLNKICKILIRQKIFNQLKYLKKSLKKDFYKKEIP